MLLCLLNGGSKESMLDEQLCWSSIKVLKSVPLSTFLSFREEKEVTSLRTYDKARQQILDSAATGTPESLSSKRPHKWWTAIEYRIEWSGERGQKCF